MLCERNGHRKNSFFNLSWQQLSGQYKKYPLHQSDFRNLVRNVIHNDMIIRLKDGLNRAAAHGSVNECSIAIKALETYVMQILTGREDVSDMSNDQINEMMANIGASRSFTGRTVTERIINNCNDNNEPTLCAAVRNGNRGVIEFLFAHGADVNCKDDAGNMPLHIAAKNGLIGIADLLIKRLDNIDANGYMNNTPLHLAIENGHRDIAALLIDNGADVNAKNNDHDTPLIIAVLEEHTGIVELLMRANINADDKDRSLIIAAKEGHRDIVKLLIDKGADVNAEDNHGNTPLHDATREGNRDIVELLIDKGADVNAEDNHGNTPLLIAILRNDIETFNLLLNKFCDGRDNDDIDVSGNEVVCGYYYCGVLNELLHVAAEEGCEEIAELLIDKGANISSQDNDEYTPLHYAIGKEHTDIIKLLLDHAVEASGSEYLDNLLSINSEDDIDGINNVFDYDDTYLHYAALVGNIKAVEFLLSKVKVDDTNLCDCTPLHFAARKGHTKVVQLLIESGANINAGDNDRETPLHFAARKGHTKVVQLLIDKGANINYKNYDNCTPLDCAILEGHVAVVEILLKSGAEVNYENCYDGIPLHRDIVELLFGNGINLCPSIKRKNTDTDVDKVSQNKKKKLDSHSTPDSQISSIDINQPHCSKDPRFIGN